MRDDSIPCCEVEFWAYSLVCLVLVSFAGVTSGLALGLLSFSQVDLEVLIKAGKPRDQKNAEKIMPLVRNQHFLLCTLLVAKTLATAALPIFLDIIMPIWAAIIMSVILVVAFSEIIPQAVCARHGLSIGAKSSAFVRMLLVIFYPVAYPISKLLDWLLGKGHSALLRRAELKTLVDLHANEAGKGGDLSHHETSIISGALDLTQKTAKDAMTPISETFALDINSKLDMHTMSLIMSKGHSRIPIYSGRPNNIIGLILLKNLVFCRPEDEIPIKQITIRRIPMVYEDWPLYDILTEFRGGYSHMAVVVQSKKDERGMLVKLLQEERTEALSPVKMTEQELEPNFHHQIKNWVEMGENFFYEDLVACPRSLDGEIIGIITLEDVMEELLQEEILDETDDYINVHNRIKINPPLLGRSSSKSDLGVSVSIIEQSPVSSYASAFQSPICHTFSPRV